MFSPSPFSWTKSLPLILLGLRSTVMEDIGCTTGELVHGTTLRLPEEIIVDYGPVYLTEVPTYYSRLKKTTRHVQSTPSRKHIHPTQNHKEAFFRFSCFRSCGCRKKPLQQPNDEPYIVIERNNKYFFIARKGKQVTVNIDRLKLHSSKTATRLFQYSTK